MCKFSSVYKLKETLPNCAMAKGWHLIATDFPIDINGKMMYVFTEFSESSTFTPIGILSVVLTKEQVEVYLEYVKEYNLL